VKLLREYERAFRRAGLQIVETNGMSGTTHLRVLVAAESNPSISATMRLSLSPSDYRNFHNAVRDAKRALRQAGERHG
jgi:hypothetical protein